MAPPIKASDFNADLGEFLETYKYQPKLTPRLDSLEGTGFTQELLNEIVLWKVNRFVELSGNLLRDIEDLRKLKAGEHKKAEPLLALLLRVHGVDLPMASTILRFRSPTVFQIIDRRAYRAIFGSDYPLHTTSSVVKKTAVYFDYLDELIKLCNRKKLKFEIVDRILYEFDKAKNGRLKEPKAS